MPATRTTIYQQLIPRNYALSHRTRNDGDTTRWLIRFVPAENEALLAADVTYEDLPAGTILGKSEGDVSFPDGVPIGHPQAEQWSIEIDYRKLPSDLKAWLTEDSTVTATVEGQTYFVSGVFILSSDRGDTALDPDEFTVEFMGVHRHQGRATYTLSDHGGPVTISLTLQHIAKACLDAIPIEALRAYVIDNYLGDMVTVSELYQTLYKKTGHNRAYGVGMTGRGLQWAWLLPITLLEGALYSVMEEILSTYLRTYGVLPWATSEAGTSGDYIIDDDKWILNEQVHTAGREAGASLATGFGTVGNGAHIVALVSTAATATDTSGEDGEEWIGGLLGGGENAADQPVGRGDDSLFALGNCYDVLRYLAENFGGKVLPFVTFSPDTPVGIYSVVFDCLPPTSDDATATGLPYEVVTPGDFAGQVQWTPNEKDLRGCEYEVPDVRGDDLDTVSYYVPGSSANEKPYKLTALVHNLPAIGELYDKITGNNAVVVEAGLSLTGNYSVAMHFQTGFDLRGLYYLGQPGFASAEIAIRVSSCCTYKFGHGATGPGPDVRQITLDLPGFEYPSIADLGTFNTPANKQTYIDLVFKPLFAALIQEQRSINMLSAVCRFIVKLYGRNANSDDNPHGAASLKGTLVGHWPAGAIVGRRIALSSSSDGFTESQTATTLWDATPSQRSVAIVKAGSDDIAGTTQIEGVATDDRQYYEAP